MAKDFEKMSRNEKIKYFSNLQHNQLIPKSALDKCTTKAKMLDTIRPLNQSLANYLITLSFNYALQFIWDIYLDQNGSGLDLA